MTRWKGSGGRRSRNGAAGGRGRSMSEGRHDVDCRRGAIVVFGSAAGGTRLAIPNGLQCIGGLELLQVKGSFFGAARMRRVAGGVVFGSL